MTRDDLPVPARVFEDAEDQRQRDRRDFPMRTAKRFALAARRDTDLTVDGVETAARAEARLLARDDRDERMMLSHVDTLAEKARERVEGREGSR